MRGDSGRPQQHRDKLSGNDLGLTYDADETVSDQLYTKSFAAVNF